ncbi:MAG: glutaredoxin domain-containing protein [Acidimicrobiales bacterium]
MDEEPATVAVHSSNQPGQGDKLEWWPVGRGCSSVDRPAGSPEVLVYWRPGCPYCAGLRRRLRKLGLATTEVNIWADPSAAATVRRVAGGNETVPTVLIGDTSLVNPTAPAVLDVAARLAPDAIEPERISRSPTAWPAIRIAPWLVIWAVLAVGAAAQIAGHSALSWSLTAVAIAVCLASRVARR